MVLPAVRQYWQTASHAGRAQTYSWIITDATVPQCKSWGCTRRGDPDSESGAQLDYLLLSLWKYYSIGWCSRRVGVPKLIRYDTIWYDMIVIIYTYSTCYTLHGTELIQGFLCNIPAGNEEEPRSGLRFPCHRFTSCTSVQCRCWYVYYQCVSRERTIPLAWKTMFRSRQVYIATQI